MMTEAIGGGVDRGVLMYVFQIPLPVEVNLIALPRDAIATEMLIVYATDLGIDGIMITIGPDTETPLVRGEGQGIVA